MAAGISNLQGETSYRYRKFKSDSMMAVTVGATIVTLIPLFLVLGYLLTKGFASLNWAFFTAMPAPVGEKGGGMANAIVGTLEVVGIACLIGVPIGVGAGLYLAANRASRFTNWVRFSADVLMGVPSIVVGIFAYAVIVRPFGGFSTLAGSVALAAIMVPLVTRTTEEMCCWCRPSCAKHRWRWGCRTGARRCRWWRARRCRESPPALSWRWPESRARRRHCCLRRSATGSGQPRCFIRSTR